MLAGNNLERRCYVNNVVGAGEERTCWAAVSSVAQVKCTWRKLKWAGAGRDEEWAQGEHGQVCEKPPDLGGGNEIISPL